MLAIIGKFNVIPHYDNSLLLLIATPAHIDLLKLFVALLIEVLRGSGLIIISSTSA